MSPPCVLLVTLSPLSPRKLPAAQFIQLVDSLPGLGLQHISQSLSVDRARRGILLAENSAVLRLGMLGKWKVRLGGWDGRNAQQYMLLQCWNKL